MIIYWVLRRQLPSTYSPPDLFSKHPSNPYPCRLWPGLCQVLGFATPYPYPPYPWVKNLGVTPTPVNPYFQSVSSLSLRSPRTSDHSRSQSKWKISIPYSITSQRLSSMAINNRPSETTPKPANSNPTRSAQRACTFCADIGHFMDNCHLVAQYITQGKV